MTETLVLGGVLFAAGLAFYFLGKQTEKRREAERLAKQNKKQRDTALRPHKPLGELLRDDKYLSAPSGEAC